MADKDITIGIVTTANTAGLAATEKAMTGVTQKAAAITTKSATMGAGMGKMGMLANQASYQVGDFVTQVQMGTSAVRAFSQQAPQLIGAFSMAGLVTGPLGLALAGISVALPLVAMGFSKLGGAAKESSEDMAKAMEKAREAEDKAIEIQEQNATARREAAQAVVQKWDATAAAQQKAADAAIEADAAMLQMREELNTSLGKTVDLSKEWLAIEQRRRALAAEEAAAPAVQAANQAAAAQQAARAAADSIEARRQLNASKASEHAGVIATAGGQLRDARTQLGNLPTKADYLLGQYDFSEIASISNRKDQLAARIAKLEKTIAEETGKKEAAAKMAESLAKNLEGAENKFQEAARDATDKANAARIAQEEATAAMDRATALDEWGKVKDGMAKRAEELTGILDTVTPLNARQQEAVASLRTLTADGTLAAEETKTLAAQATQLVGGLQVGISETTGNQRQIIALINQLVTEQKQAAAEVSRLNQRVNSLQLR